MAINRLFLERDIISRRDGDRPDTQSLTLRLPKSSVEMLKKIAAKKKITANALVSQMIDSFLEWEINAAEAGWITMPKPFLVELFKEFDKEKVRHSIQRISKQLAKDITHYMKGRHDLASWISIIKGRAERSGFNLSEHQEGRDLVIIMQHDMGENWSIYFKTFYENVFEDLEAKVDFDYTDKSLIMRLHNPPEHLLYRR